MPNDRNAFTVMKEDFDAAAQTEDGEAYAKLTSTLEKMDASLREYAQEMTLSAMKDTLQKLKKGENLSGNDINQLKLWIVGDAEYYTQMENNYADWKAELKRLIDKISSNWAENPTIDQIMKLRGMTRDAIRTTADIFYFVQQKERVENFKDSTGEIDADERAILIKHLTQKIKSPHF